MTRAATRVFLILLGVSAGNRAAAHGQGAYCKPLDKTGEFVLATAQNFATQAAESTYRTKSWKTPLVGASEVAYVTDESVCEQAARAYDRELTPQTPSVGRGVYVVRIASWYLVVDSESRAGEWMRGVILDSTYAKHSGALLL